MRTKFASCKRCMAKKNMVKKEKKAKNKWSMVMRKMKWIRAKTMS
jgi:hypothetical protein